MTTRAHDELSGDRYSAEARSCRVRKEGYRSATPRTCMKAPRTMASLTCDHGTRNIPGVSCREVFAVPVGVMAVLCTADDLTERRNPGAKQVSRWIEIRVLARQPVSRR